MAKSEKNIQNLPTHVLEEIFSYLPKKMDLRLVSKTFLNVINESLKLMSNFSLNISKLEKNDIKNVNAFYQELGFNLLEPKDVEIVKQYKWKKFVKAISFDTFEKDLRQSAKLIKQVLSNFDNMLDIHLYIHLFHEYKKDEKYPSEYEYQNIKSLTIDDPLSNGLQFFTNAPNLKKLKTNGDMFVHPVNWKLEELEMDDFIDEDAVLIGFLKKQSSTLKVLKLYYHTKEFNEIVRHLKNLEVLHVKLTKRDFIGKNCSESDNKLKEFCMINSSISAQLLGQILKHYKNIEKLYLDFRKIDGKYQKMQTDAKHITVAENSFECLQYIYADNLTSLTVLEKSVKLKDLEKIPATTLNNIETLKIMIADYLKIGDFLLKFPSLQHLYLTAEKNISNSELRSILKTKTDLKTLGVWEEYWKVKDKGLSQNRAIKTFNYCDSMLTGTDLEMCQRHDKVYSDYDSDDDNDNAGHFMFFDHEFQQHRNWEALRGLNFYASSDSD